MKTTTTSILLSLFFIISCKEAKKTEEATSTSQMEDVMAIHNEVMPKMGDIGKLVAKLKSKIDTTDTGQEYKKAMKDLQEANNSMMNWMHDFGDSFDSDEILNGKELTDEKQELLKIEQKKIKEVKEKINASIKHAEELLKDN